jgi:UDPglucose 6-dehydrogenase
LIEELTRLGAKVKAYDPLISSASHYSELERVALAANPEDLAQDCDAIVLVTDWKEFRSLNYADLAQRMITPVLIDGRNYLNVEAIAEAGFYYVGIGCPSAGVPIVNQRMLSSVSSSVFTSAA